jgi:CHAD domain-containing protein
MITKEQQYKYLSKKTREIIFDLRQLSDPLDQAAIHRLRVELKKMRGILHFLETCSEQPLRKTFHSLKSIARQSGEVRDAYNNLVLAQQVHLSDAVVREQSQLLSIAGEALLGDLKKYARDLKRSEKELVVTESIRRRSVTDWYQSQLRQIAGLFSSLSGEALHEARKRIKHLLYVQHWLQANPSSSEHLNIEYLDRLQEAIGKWHDREMVRQVLVRMGASAEEGSIALQKEWQKAREQVFGLADDFLGKAISYASTRERLYYQRSVPSPSARSPIYLFL